MFLSDEPGYYEDGAFGIRIESIILTKDVKLKHNNDDKGFLCFEPVTLVPIQQVNNSAITSFTLHIMAPLITLASQCIFTMAGRNHKIT